MVFHCWNHVRLFDSWVVKAARKLGEDKNVPPYVNDLSRSTNNGYLAIIDWERFQSLDIQKLWKHVKLTKFNVQVQTILQCGESKSYSKLFKLFRNIKILVKPSNEEIMRWVVMFPWWKVVPFVRSILLTHNLALACTQTATKRKPWQVPSAAHYNTSGFPNYYLHLQMIQMFVC